MDINNSCGRRSAEVDFASIAATYSSATNRHAEGRMRSAQYPNHLLAAQWASLCRPAHHPQRQCDHGKRTFDFAWSNGATTPTITIPQPQSTTYSVSLNKNCSATGDASFPVTVVPTPPAPSYTGAAALCQGPNISRQPPIPMAAPSSGSVRQMGPLRFSRVTLIYAQPAIAHRPADLLHKIGKWKLPKCRRSGQYQRLPATQCQCWAGQTTDPATLPTVVLDGSSSTPAPGAGSRMRGQAQASCRGKALPPLP